MATLVAIPSANPGGLDAALMSHFGHCEVFTIVEMDGTDVKEVSVLPNLPHEHGGCAGPVRYLAERGVGVMIAGGMGMRPLQSFQESGIQVLFSGTAATVDQALQGFIKGSLPAFGDNGLCKGGCGGHH